jgi:hypothetical protein
MRTRMRASTAATATIKPRVPPGVSTVSKVSKQAMGFKDLGQWVYGFMGLWVYGFKLFTAGTAVVGVECEYKVLGYSTAHYPSHYSYSTTPTPPPPTVPRTLIYQPI